MTDEQQQQGQSAPYRGYQARPRRSGPPGKRTLDRKNGVRYKRDGTPARKPGPKPGSAAAKRGGQVVAALYGPDHYRKLGRAGAQALRQSQAPGHFAEIGRLGGEATRAKYGIAHYQRIGKLHGAKYQDEQDEQQQKRGGKGRTP